MAFEVGEDDKLRCAVDHGSVRVSVYVSCHGSLATLLSPEDAEKVAEYLRAAALVARHGE